MMANTLNQERGATLIEVLVAILVLSFGMLALAGMMAYSVQLPKFAAYRATAAVLAADHVERIRANASGFAQDFYKETMTYGQTPTPHTPCVYPNCTAQLLAQLDKFESNQAIRAALPQGGMRVTCNGACTSLSGDLWVMWQEPTTFASLGAATSDECPDATVAPTFTPFTAANQPRCLHIKFQL